MSQEVAISLPCLEELTKQGGRGMLGVNATPPPPHPPAPEVSGSDKISEGGKSQLRELATYMPALLCDASW